ncbi:FadR/GntR family transcriptional regulator [Paenibacillus gorillae]|uniref:FadR/GntR family transcriptional regulator n=1 Tax=Paenibacillus gorillae TaxID=1243662 RepID=UPI0005A663A2|nr:FadR/GntR family transcriptional regulator [Paenibacillus gorillae]
MLKQTNRMTLVEQAAEQMERLIESGTWPVGQKIAAEQELMEQLQISRNTLREAVRALVHAGLLKTRQGDGTYVVSSSKLGVVLQQRIEQTELLKTLEVRYALEREAARLAALRRDDEDIEILKQRIQDYEREAAGGDHDAFVAADIKLHIAIVAAAHNELLHELYMHVIDAVTFTIQKSGCYPDHNDDFLLTHKKTVQAIIDGNVSLAGDAVTQYIEVSKTSLDHEETK